MSAQVSTVSLGGVTILDEIGDNFEKKFQTKTDGKVGAHVIELTI